MFSINPFAALSATLSPSVMQAFVIVMIALVVSGTVADIVHKGSAKYFFENLRRSRGKAKATLGGGTLASIAVQTVVHDVLASGEFCNPRRRVAHLLTMYGFIVYVVTTALLICVYPTPATPAPAIVPQLWWLGAAMACIGGYWFWFFIRVDVATEGGAVLRLMRADLFIVSLLASLTLGLVWAALQASGSGAAMVVFGLYVLATVVLFGSVPWSKFAHMFFKPAAAFEKRVSQANGTRANLPAPADAPLRLGSPRRQTRHY